MMQNIWEPNSTLSNSVQSYGAGYLNESFGNRASDLNADLFVLTDEQIDQVLLEHDLDEIFEKMNEKPVTTNSSSPLRNESTSASTSGLTLVENVPNVIEPALNITSQVNTLQTGLVVQNQSAEKTVSSEKLFNIPSNDLFLEANQPTTLSQQARKKISRKARQTESSTIARVVKKSKK